MTRIGVLVVTLAALLVPTAPAGAAPVGQFRELAEVGTGLVDLASDGERFAWVQTRPRVPSLGSIRIYDTLRARDFELVAPKAGCGFAGIAGGVAQWVDCNGPGSLLFTDLATGQTHEPVGIRPVYAMARDFEVCYTGGFGRHWVIVSCGPPIGGGGPEVVGFLNHRTGEFRRGDYDSAESPLLDLDYEDLMLAGCRLAGLSPGNEYQPPFALLVGRATARLGRCGSGRAVLLGRCGSGACGTARLGSGYVTWSEGRSVWAYLPRIRRRVLAGRFSGEMPGRPVQVAHTCNRVFVRWRSSVYVARVRTPISARSCRA